MANLFSYPASLLLVRFLHIYIHTYIYIYIYIYPYDSPMYCKRWGSREVPNSPVASPKSLGFHLPWPNPLSIRRPGATIGRYPACEGWGPVTAGWLFDVFGSEDPMAWEGIGKSRITNSANRGVVNDLGRYHPFWGLLLFWPVPK